MEKNKYFEISTENLSEEELQEIKENFIKNLITIETNLGFKISHFAVREVNSNE